ncbi:putative ubiquitin domain-containing protein [Erysiphe neolycopersici]|uniref:Putative ubiquitin domain-containing protein n=1 Tax=Erysiphe neolycopersici TaxID=212602 RepID=A0A420HUF1_9PEZI|nr:putative ubiquitin domain-containing protein [Erysiphe neolycopersici]
MYELRVIIGAVSISSYVFEDLLSADGIILCSSSRVINSSQLHSQAALPHTLTHTTSHSDRQDTQECSPKSPLHKSLQRQVWSSTSRTWTTAELDRERADFFDTRTSGRPEVWQTIKAVLEILWTGRDSENGIADDSLGTAQQFLDAAEIIVPHNNLSPGVYDSFGAYYPIPRHIISDPTNVVLLPKRDDSGKQEKPEISKEHDDEETIRRREEKGKNVIDPENMIKLRAKLSDRDVAPIQVLIGRNDSVRLVARKIAEESALPPSRFIRIAYMGRILKETQSLQSQGWKDEHVVNALVFG